MTLSQAGDRESEMLLCRVSALEEQKEMLQTGHHASISPARRGWWIPSLLLALGGALLFPFPMQGRGWNAVFDIAHAPSFFLATLALAMLLDPTFTIGIPARALVTLSPRRFLAIAILVALLGAVFELAQRFVGRSMSVSDAMANSAGALSAALLVCSRRQSGRSRRMLFVSASATLLMMPLVEPILELQEVIRARKEFPLIASFERDRELKPWQSFTADLTRSDEWASSGNFSLKMLPVGNQAFMNVLMAWPPGNWSEYHSLKFHVRNAGSETVKMQLHLGDWQHTQTGYEPGDRFRREFLLPPQEATPISISIREIERGSGGRLLNMRSVSFLNVVFEKKNDLVVFIDDLKLFRTE
ncbi:MAG: hypothetical protein ACK58L_13175 [Planctomycetota bacterium]